ncbi:uncharacterized protein LOC111640237 isoform X1 [Centruroides sculpturatus]|uniref:uncharacterized protein LOC111640237 isoform X1 n=1 Tax=Centruroides sculpturatus TaxID=218467 RepID=UPI000C6DA92C|nr:uncharacterized protein LOC111640237 isoform X1 [Centruroides sculpturatus]
MFLTLCYAFLTVVVQRQRRRLADLLRERLGCGTVLFHKNNSTSSSKFTDGEIKIVKPLLEKDEKRVSLLLPKQKINLSTWNCYGDYQHGQLSRSFPAVNSVNILFEIICCEANERRDRNSKSCLNVEEYCIPMAWRSNEVFGILVKSSVEDLNLLGAAFLNDQLCMSEGKEIHKMMTVDVEGSPIDSVHPFSFPLSSPSSWSSCLLQTDSTTSTPLVEQTPELCERLLVEGGAENAEEDFLHTPVFPPLEVIEQQEYCDTYGGSNESLAENVLSLLEESLSDSETSLNGDRDSLCSQLSNEGEAASQSSSPRKLVDSIYCNLDNSIDEFEEAEEYCAGEAMAEGSFSPIPDLDEMIFITNNIPKIDASSKPPNIFIYTGEEESGPSSLFRSIKDNLQLCLKPNCYTIYSLTPTQVEEYCIPMAWRSNEVFGILVKSSVEDLNLLGAAFLNDQLCMSEGKEIHKMMTVDVEGSPIDSVHPFSFPLSSPSSWSSCLLQTDSTTSTPLVEQTPELCERLLVEGGAENAEEDFLHTPVFPPLEVIEQQEYCDTYGGSNESLAENVLSLLEESLSDSETSLNGDRDSLCSQLSNEGEAASQSSSPRKLVDSIYCNLDNSIDEFEEAEEYCAGEAMAEGSFSPIPDLDEMIFITNNIPKIDASSKPPNIFIYTGEEESGPSSLFRSIKDNLQLCLKPNCYTIYSLTPTQVNQIVWRDNTELLIVSCDELNEKVNKCFSAFVHSGGKVLSFCSNLDILSYKLSYEDNVLGKSVVKMKYKEWDTVSLMRGRFRCRDGLQKKNVFVLGTNEDDGEALIKVFHSQNNSGISVMCQVMLNLFIFLVNFFYSVM